MRDFFKCYSSQKLITLNTLHEVVPTWYSFHSWVDLSNANLGAELIMLSFTVDCDTFSNDEKVAVDVPVTCVEVAGSEAMIALSFSILLVKCLMKILGRSVQGWQYLRWMSIWVCIIYLVQFFTGRCQSYSFSVKFTSSCMQMFLNLVLCLSI